MYVSAIYMPMDHIPRYKLLLNTLIPIKMYFINKGKLN